MNIISKLSFYIGIFINSLYIVFFFVMQIYTLNLYWIVILICLINIYINYINEDLGYIKRIILYLLIILSAFGIYGFGAYCFGDKIFYIISKDICISLDVLFEKPFNITTYVIKTMVWIAIFFTEIGFILKIMYIDSKEK